MKRFAAGLAASGYLLTAGCGSPESAPPLSEMPGATAEQEWLDGSNGELPSEQILKEKSEKITAALDAADYVAATTGDPQAKEVIEFAKPKAVPSVITSLGPLAVNGTVPKPEEFFVVTLSDNDAGLNPISDGLLKAAANGVYLNNLDTLFLYEKADFSREWLGILALHELSHAKNNQTGDPNDPLEEAKTRRFQHRLAGKLFGQAYADTLHATTESFRPGFNAFIENNEALIIPEINTDGISSGSPQEKRFANQTVLFNSLFNLLDEKFGTSDLTVHQQIYDSLTAQLYKTPGA